MPIAQQLDGAGEADDPATDDSDVGHPPAETTFARIEAVIRPLPNICRKSVSTLSHPLILTPQ